MRIVRLLAVPSLVALMIGASACSSPTTGPSTTTAHDSAGKVDLEGSHSYRMAASSKTRSSTGVTTWRLLSEGPSTAVIEGVDAKGHVELATSFQYRENVLHIVAYRVGPKKFSDQVARAKWQKLMAAFNADSRLGTAVTEFSAHGAERPQKKQTCSAFWCTQEINDPGDSDNEQTCSGFYCRNVIRNPGEGTNKQTCSAWICRQTIERTQNATQAFQEMSNLTSESFDKSDGKTEPAEGDPNPAGEEGADPATEDPATEDPATEDPAMGEGDEAGGELDEGEVDAPEQDDNLDEDGGLEAQDDAADFGDESGGDGADEGGGEGGDDAGDEGAELGDEGADFGDEGGGDAADEGGGDAAGDEGGGGGGEEEFALHNRCQRLSCSKSSSVCICTRY